MDVANDGQFFAAGRQIRRGQEPRFPIDRIMLGFRHDKGDGFSIFDDGRHPRREVFANRDDSLDPGVLLKRFGDLVDELVVQE